MPAGKASGWRSAPNGTLITADIARNIRESGIEYAGISLDGATPATHDRFWQMPGGVRAFHRRVLPLPGCRPTQRGQDHPDNRELRRTWCAGRSRKNDRGQAGSACTWLVPTGRGIDAYHRLQWAGSRNGCTPSALLQGTGDRRPGPWNSLPLTPRRTASIFLNPWNATNPRTCAMHAPSLPPQKAGAAPGDRVANIDPQGNVYPCQFARAPEFLVGNVRERPFSELWDDASNPVLARFRERPVRLTGRCGTCRHRELCGGGCRVRACAVSGDFYADDPFCYVQDNPVGKKP